MTDLTKKWQELKNKYPAVEKYEEGEEVHTFDKWVHDMGFDGIIAINGIKGQNDEAIN